MPCLSYSARFLDANAIRSFGAISPSASKAHAVGKHWKNKREWAFIRALVENRKDSYRKTTPVHFEPSPTFFTHQPVHLGFFFQRRGVRARTSAPTSYHYGRSRRPHISFRFQDGIKTWCFPCVASGGSLLYYQCVLFAILKPKNKKNESLSLFRIIIIIFPIESKKVMANG